MRIDKFLKVSRVIKRRTVANEAADGGRVSVNGRQVKASYDVKVGDVVEIAFANGPVKFRVKSISETVKKADAQEMYELL
ncbi:MAG: RNA-binding S4 domain-containing protein [Clostridia bacterium]|jgi:ribosomal 50S subunit-recycling heat shock protein|nr:RNA-binding S4 domain-containing protein [Clostridia bacterium]MBO7504031.1 RNA-binding S4 domain-containing protein [Clostridia bacterium]MBO7658568.1 RNA-binding S4 domain-containing protein [Clostridia bacterium]MBP5666074.1 RNA-binding S4 domain-containing protein [Clostridia bacterium]MBP5766204.1 RNA-binding S4 domain-containing protein [Clostridia bacterium]